MGSEGRRVRILCEDRRTERFLRRLCERYGVRVETVVIAPAGRGAASAWVRLHYADEVRRHRARSYQANLGLLVAIDGDNLGLIARMSELAVELSARQLSPRAPEESIAVFVPTWSVETWLAVLVGRDDVDESRTLKDDPALRERFGERALIHCAADAWPGAPSSLPSLVAAREEGPRVGFTVDRGA